MLLEGGGGGISGTSSSSDALPASSGCLSSLADWVRERRRMTVSGNGVPGRTLALTEGPRPGMVPAPCTLSPGCIRRHGCCPAPPRGGHRRALRHPCWRWRPRQQCRRPHHPLGRRYLHVIAGSARPRAPAADQPLLLLLIRIARLQCLVWRITIGLVVHKRYGRLDCQVCDTAATCYSLRPTALFVQFLDRLEPLRRPRGAVHWRAGKTKWPPK
ncbi:hypothetical protein DL89DRAFT_58484 [Linderina pennispora]|uniref:Uncharacterized protein n=1 Tax=Linderina pennispora TaxID=61395 RepID=A0A1Y1W0B0_9FUNG|nr:uncharacterized protein DL89DRAFT_58484 [Linderina pennispora]ORX66696.1 hypothetical protein DL89DRAFT_58484 [Linderina pennispora]